MLRRSCPVPTAPPPPLPLRIRAAVSTPIGRYLSQQAALPHGIFGRLLARIWVKETAAVNDAAIELLKPQPGERICEIGFGPGRTLAHLAATGAHGVSIQG